MGTGSGSLHPSITCEQDNGTWGQNLLINWCGEGLIVVIDERRASLWWGGRN